MEIMLDSANLNEIKHVKKLGLLDGVTTNPSIIKRGIEETKYAGDFIDYAKRILEITEDKPVFFQVGGVYSKRRIIEQAKRIYKSLSSFGKVYIKVPINVGRKGYSGFESIQDLMREDIPTLATAIVTPTQAFLAAKAGAEYLAIMLRPYDNNVAEVLEMGDLGREGYLNNKKVLALLREQKKMFDSYLSGLDVLDRTDRILKNQNLETKLVVAGIRNPLQLSEVLERGSSISATIPFSVFNSLFTHNGTNKFIRDTYAACRANTLYGRFLRNGK